MLPRLGSLLRLVVIDLPNLAMRAAFAGAPRGPDKKIIPFPPERSTPSALRQLERHIDWLNPTHVILAQDGDGPCFRKALSGSYKESRTVRTRPYVDALAQRAAARGLVSISVPGFEGDDILATFAARAQADEVYLLTGDSDARAHVQEATPGDPRTVRVVLPAPASAEPTILDAATVSAKYGVEHAWQVTQHKALMGEDGDDVDGVPDIGEGRASMLIRKYGSVEGVIEAGQAATAERWARHVAAHADVARQALRLVSLRTDVPIDPSILALGDVLRVPDPSHLPRVAAVRDAAHLARTVAERSSAERAPTGGEPGRPDQLALL